MDRSSKAAQSIRSRPAVIGCFFLSFLCLFLTYQLYTVRSSFRGQNFSDFRALTSSPSSAANPLTTSLDLFQNFTGRSTCGFSSLDLHVPSGDVCTDRAAFLASVSDGGRRGFQAPYAARTCDYRFYSTAQVCEILSRFEDVIFLGDSMTRHIVGALAMLLRENVEFGAQAQWIDRDRTMRECSCDSQSYLFGCHATELRDLRGVFEHDPSSIKCGAGARPPNLSYAALTGWPLGQANLDDLTSFLSPTPPAKPYAFVLGHGAWNDFNLTATDAWVRDTQAHILAKAPYLADDAGASGGGFFPRLFIGPNAAGVNKPFVHLEHQGNIALAQFERATRERVPRLGPEYLGTWNMSIQSNTPDGTHSGIRTNLLKAMAVLQWLDMLEVPPGYNSSRSSLGT